MKKKNSNNNNHKKYKKGRKLKRKNKKVIEHVCTGNQLGCLDFVTGEALYPDCPMYNKNKQQETSSSQIVDSKDVDNIILEHNEEEYFKKNFDIDITDYIESIEKMNECDINDNEF